MASHISLARRAQVILGQRIGDLELHDVQFQLCEMDASPARPHSRAAGCCPHPVEHSVLKDHAFSSRRVHWRHVLLMWARCRSGVARCLHRWALCPR